MTIDGILACMTDSRDETTGWLVSVTPVLHGSERIHFAAAYKTTAEAELAVRARPEGRGNQVVVVRPLNVIEMMHLRMKSGEIRRHD